MGNSASNIVNEIKSLVINYMPEEAARDFFETLEKNISLDKEEIILTTPEKEQIDYNIPGSIKYRRLIDKVITDLEKFLEKEQYYKLILDLSQLMIFAGENIFAVEIAEYLLSLLPNDQFVRIKAECYLMISRAYWAQAYWEECNYYTDKARDFFISVNNNSGISQCENMLGTLYGEKGEFDEAQIHFENALSYLKDENDQLSYAMILTNLGIIKAIEGDYENAICSFKDSIEKFQIINDTRRLSRVFHNLGMLYTRLGNYDAALEEFNKSITLSLENNYLSNCAIAYIGKAFIYTKIKNFALADAYTNKAMEIAYRINDSLSIADIYKIKGIIQNDMENFQLSEELFENSLRLNKDMENKYNQAETSEEMGKLLQKNGREEEAKKYNNDAANYFNLLSSKN